MAVLKRKVVLALIAIALSLVLFLWAMISNSLGSRLIVKEEFLDYQVKTGRSLSAVLFDLNRKEIIDHPRYLLWYARLTGQSANMKAGEYRLTSDITAKQLLEKMFTGDVVQYSLTVIEGWNFKQMLNAIQQHPQIKTTLNGLSGQEIMHKLGASQLHPEGQFLPDTYHFTRGMTDLEILKRAYSALQSTLKKEWSKRAVGLPYKSAYEALIMASIVEKETGKASERQQIAGVFVRRIEKRMRLQTDPTVIYGMGDKFKGNIRKRDLLTDTPYNTYRRRGLPPTPIALAGKDAIFAALHPADGEALYFVSKGDGSHVFSATLEEHNRAVIKYQLKGRARSFSSYKHKK